MDQYFTLKDYLLFLKQSKKTIIITSFAFVIIFSGLYYFFNILDSQGDEESIGKTVANEEIISKEEADQYLDTEYEVLTQNQQSELINYLDQEAYIFRYFIELKDGEPYREFGTVKEILTLPETIQQIQNNLNVKFKPDASRAIRMSFDQKNNVHTFLVGIGNEADNLNIAEEYYSLLENAEGTFFENKNVYLIDSTPIKNDLQEEAIDPSELQDPTSASNLVVVFILIVFAGLIVGLVTSLIKTFFSKNISSLYNYQLANTEKLVKMSHYSTRKTDSIINVISLITNNTKEKIAFLVQDDSKKNLQDERWLNNYANTSYMSVLDIPKEENFDKFIIITELNQTKKSWYTDQLKLIRNLSKDILVIEMNQNKKSN
ncbi:hypothetical protein [Lacticigenium naphthae]|uniref:hypothetical protein n=1 Tax=Lacticigenium naphthae TaxID=515351 RepID=UPI000409A974|nr:hypothetical protein [Lacticigenium naphthae]